MIAVLYSFVCIYNRFPDPDEFLIQGDDFIINIKNYDDALRFKSHMREFNLRLRLDTVGLVEWYNDIELLGYYWNQYNLTDQTDEWIISRIMYPEKYVKFEGPLRIVYRSLSIILNLKRYRELYLRFFDNDKYLRKLVYLSDEPEIILVSMSNEFLKIKIPLKRYWMLGWRML
jgi:hypothetical protein